MTAKILTFRSREKPAPPPPDKPYEQVETWGVVPPDFEGRNNSFLYRNEQMKFFNEFMQGEGRGFHNPYFMNTLPTTTPLVNQLIDLMIEWRVALRDNIEADADAFLDQRVSRDADKDNLRGILKHSMEETRERTRNAN